MQRNLLTAIASFVATICLLHVAPTLAPQAMWATASTSSSATQVALTRPQALGVLRQPTMPAGPAMTAPSRPATSVAASSAAAAALMPLAKAAGLLAVMGATLLAFFRLRRPQEAPWGALLVAGERRTLSPLYAEDWNPSMGTTLGDLFGSSWEAPTKTEEAKEDLGYYQDIELKSEAGVDYTLLKQLLKDQQWELADNEHRRLLIELAGPTAEAREYVWPTEVAAIPVQDMQMLDRLWLNYSGGKFGFSVQRKIWASFRGNWMEFFKKINWVTGENNTYRKWPKGFLWTLEAEKGHLPLTNTLRGTGLIQAVFEHPAFGGPFKNKQVRK